MQSARENILSIFISSKKMYLAALNSEQMDVQWQNPKQLLSAALYKKLQI